MILHSAKAFANAKPVEPAGPAVWAHQRQPLAFHAAGTEIYAQGERAEGLYLVTFGAVRVYRLLSDGRRQISAFHLPGEVFGFEADGTHHFFAEAIAATGLQAIKPTADADFASAVLPLAVAGLVRAQEHLLVLGRQSARERVAAFLLDMAARQGDLDEIELPMSRTDIGDYLGLTIETVSRVFSRLKETGVIRLPGLRSVVLARRNILEGMCE